MSTWSSGRSDAPAPPADFRTDRVRGRLDAVLIAARVAPATRHIGAERPPRPARRWSGSAP